MMLNFGVFMSVCVISSAAPCQYVVDHSKSLVYGNPPPPTGTTNPLEGATYVYNRNASFSGGRFTPFNISFNVWDAQCNDITADPQVQLYLKSAFHDIYQWNKPEWTNDLKRCCSNDPNVNATLLLETKANMFWELLAQAFSERVLNRHNGTSAIPLLLNYGPTCFSNESVFVCKDPGLPQVAKITVSTTIDGARDTLNPVPRQITLSAIAAPYTILNTEYEIIFSSELHVASRHREDIDLLPFVNGARLTDNIKLLAQAKPGNYPDYNLAFIPFRHLVFQGPVVNPLLPEASLSYSSLSALKQMSNTTAQLLFSPNTAAGVADRLRPFFNATYYYMYNDYNFSYNGKWGIPGYESYILDEPLGVSEGLGSRYEYLQLQMGADITTFHNSN
eukprot:m.150466 g.150466  ORF g.150466 m.150466 type:complete len:391 (+) comp30727_c0_seq1:69-1241(+)